MRSLKGLDRETQLLVATGAAVAAGCIPCLESIVGMARAEGIGESKLKSAALTGQYVKEQPNGHMRAFADELLGTHLHARSASGDGGCPLVGESTEATERLQVASSGSSSSGECGCS